MSLAHDALLEGIGIANDTLRDVFMPTYLVVTLLQPSETANEFLPVLELEDKWFFEYSAFRQQFLFKIARDDELLTQAIGEATHIALDNEIYVIAQGDTVPPMGIDVEWKLFCTRFHGQDNYSVMR
jgi:hypothetical protein